MSIELKKANEYEKTEQEKIPVEEKPAFHVAAPVGWINDPNGFSWYQGQIHLFYQYHPYTTEWGPMHWGHSVSDDMIHWKNMPSVLAPDQEYDKRGCFSGSATEKDGKHVLIYTGVSNVQMENGSIQERQNQCIAYGDGEIYVKSPQNPVITGDMLPADCSKIDFRDPKVWKKGKNYYLIVGNKNSEQKGQVVLFSSKNLEKWKFETVLAENSTGQIGTMWECPDFFELDGKYVAAGAWMCHRDEAGRYQMTRCYTGTFDGDRFKTEHQQWYDFGSNFYAVQSFEHGGRRIAIGWISDFYGEHRVKPTGACGSFSLPRELHMEQGRLFTEPVKECYGLLKERIFAVSGQDVPPVIVPGNSFFVKIKLGDDRDFLVTLAREGDDALYLERKNGVTSLVSTRKEVSEVRFPSDVSAVRYVEIFMDRRVAEVYLNHGEAAGTKLFYQESTRGHLEADFAAGSLKRLEVWTMESIWNHKS